LKWGDDEAPPLYFAQSRKERKENVVGAVSKHAQFLWALSRSVEAGAGGEGKWEVTAMAEDQERKTPQPEETAAAGKKPEQEVKLPTVPELVRLRIAELSELAWIHMGLVANPLTQRIVKDLPQARLAIDCAAALVEQLQPHLDEREKRELRTLLANLRINYVEQSK
jgi:hypothetical protein